MKMNGKKNLGRVKMRSLDFTACTTKCLIPCRRKLTKEEEEWLKNNSNRMSYADFDCNMKTVEVDKND